MDKCKFCDAVISKIPIPERDAEHITCPNCGSYEITWEASVEPLKDIQLKEKRLISSFIRKNSTGNNPLHVTTHFLKKIPDLILPIKNITSEQRIDDIVKYIAENTKKIGSPVTIGGNNTFPLFYCQDEGEFFTIIDWMEKSNLIKWYAEAYSVILERNGWQKYEELKEKNIESRKVFIAMNFDKELDEVFFNAIQPACAECNLIPMRIDLVEHNEKICDKIIAEIKESGLLIADFTGQKHGVYFEAGYAQGFGIKVIWTCKKGEEDKLHFDTRQYNHIIWENLDDLKKQLINRIKATI